MSLLWVYGHYNLLTLSERDFSVSSRAKRLDLKLEGHVCSDMKYKCTFTSKKTICYILPLQ